MHKKIIQKRRMQRIFRQDGRALIVAMDHGSYMNVLPQAADPGRIIDEIREAGADALLTNFGVADTFASNIGDMSLILRADGSGSGLDKTYEFQTRNSVENALRLNAAAVACMGFPGINGGQTLHNIAALANSGMQWNMPVLAEMMPGAFDPSMHTAENVTLAARIGVELGADIIKTIYTGDRESFGQLTAGVYAPVVVLGGSRKESEEDLLTMVHDSIQAGGAGVAVGRNVWQHPNVAGIVRALSAIIHDGATPKQALGELKTAA